MILHYTHAVRGVKGSGQCRESTFQGKSSEGKRGVFVTLSWIYFFFEKARGDQTGKRQSFCFFFNECTLPSERYISLAIDRRAGEEHRAEHSISLIFGADISLFLIGTWGVIYRIVAIVYWYQTRPDLHVRHS